MCRQSLRHAGVADVQPVTIEGAGHFPQGEATEQTWSAITEFTAQYRERLRSHKRARPPARVTS
jgi:hypothetical protein